MMSIISRLERASLVDIHGNAALADDAGLVRRPHVTQTPAHNVGDLATIVALGACNAKVSCRKDITAL